jgi:hypothetical protein
MFPHVCATEAFLYFDFHPLTRLHLVCHSKNLLLVDQHSVVATRFEWSTRRVAATIALGSGGGGGRAVPWLPRTMVPPRLVASRCGTGSGSANADQASRGQLLRIFQRYGEWRR